MRINSNEEKRKTYKSMLVVSVMAWNIALSSFFFGYTVSSLGTIPIWTIKRIFSTQLKDTTAQGLLNGCSPIGALFGALSCSFFLRKFSRRQLLLGFNFFAIVIGFLMYIPDFGILLTTRLLQGYCVGVFSVLPPLMIKEIAPLQISGILGSFTQLNICIGVFLAHFLTYIFKKITNDPSGQSFWYLIFAIPQITVSIQIILLIFVFPFETPRYLISKERKEDARKLIEYLYKQEYVDQILQLKITDFIATSKKPASSTQEQKSLLHNDDGFIKNKRRYLTMMIAIHLAAMQQFSGANAITIYAWQISEKITKGQLALLIPSLITLLRLFCTFGSSILLAKFGRKTILHYGAFFQGFSSGLVAVGFLIKESFPESSEVLVLIGLFTFMAVFGLSFGPLVWLYIPEIAPANVIPYSTTTNWVTASMVIILFPIITADFLNGNPGILFLFFTFWSFASFIINIYLVIQTKDKTDKMIKEEYDNLKLCNK